MLATIRLKLCARVEHLLLVVSTRGLYKSRRRVPKKDILEMGVVEAEVKKLKYGPRMWWEEVGTPGTVTKK